MFPIPSFDQRPTCLLLMIALVMTGCANMTPSQKKAWGTGLGAVAGALAGGLAGAALDDNDRGRGATYGAAAGALVGGAIGYYVSQTQVNKLEDQQQAEARVRQETGQTQLKPDVRIEELQSVPKTIAPGEEVQVRGVYQAIGQGAKTLNGEIVLLKDNRVLTKACLGVLEPGRGEFTKTITLPAEAQGGQYDVRVILDYGQIRDIREASFNVA